MDTVFHCEKIQSKIEFLPQVSWCLGKALIQLVEKMLKKQFIFRIVIIIHSPVLSDKNIIALLHVNPLTFKGYEFFFQFFCLPNSTGLLKTNRLFCAKPMNNNL